VVLLAHQPVQVGQAATAGVDLQLSGHTHGGQLWPFDYVMALDQPVIDGLSRYGDTQLYSPAAPATGPRDADRRPTGGDGRGARLPEELSGIETAMPRARNARGRGPLLSAVTPGLFAN
jgi:hypothetical protein